MMMEFLALIAVIVLIATISFPRWWKGIDKRHPDYAKRRRLSGNLFLLAVAGKLYYDEGTAPFEEMASWAGKNPGVAVIGLGFLFILFRADFGLDSMALSARRGEPIEGKHFRMILPLLILIIALLAYRHSGRTGPAEEPAHSRSGPTSGQ